MAEGSHERSSGRRKVYAFEEADAVDRARDVVSAWLDRYWRGKGDIGSLMDLLAYSERF